jgi:hypothetical protein
MAVAAATVEEGTAAADPDRTTDSIRNATATQQQEQRWIRRFGRNKIRGKWR